MVISDIRQVMCQAIMNVSPYAIDALRGDREIVDPSLNFCDLGLNSVDYAQVMLEVMDRIEVQLPLSTFVHLSKVNEVVDLLYVNREAQAAALKRPQLIGHH